VAFIANHGLGVEFARIQDQTLTAHCAPIAGLTPKNFSSLVRDWHTQNPPFKRQYPSQVEGIDADSLKSGFGGYVIRYARLTQARLDAWLVDQGLPSVAPSYRLRLWRDEQLQFPPIQTELVAYVTEAFEDARRRLKKGFEDDLSPFFAAARDPTANFPTMLHRVTLQGYLGELFAIIAVEHWGAHGANDWRAPAFLFRFHTVEFQHLEQIDARLLDGERVNPDAPNEMRPGRTGDDGLAFRMGADGEITHVLALEAKCYGANSNQAIADAHGKLAGGPVRPTGVRELIEILSEYNTADAQHWQRALLALWQRGYRNAGRLDGVAYVCGAAPAMGRVRRSWLPANAPRPEYNVRRSLEAMEFHVGDLQALIAAIFRGA
jgi:hypothetical protein